jgi:hypothetical protein
MSSVSNFNDFKKYAYIKGLKSCPLPLLSLLPVHHEVSSLCHTLLAAMVFCLT